MISRILDLFENNDSITRKEARQYKEMAVDRFRDELAARLHDICVRLTADFVSRELHKKDSVFGAIDRSRFFHEIMIVNVWAVGKVFAKGPERLAEKVYECYVRTFHPEDGPVMGYTFDAFLEKQKGYNEEWDEETGHQDEFGTKVAEGLFGSKELIPNTPQVSFWMVEYTHTLMKKLKHARKQCLSAKLPV